MVTPLPSETTPASSQRDLKDVEANKDLAALSYAWIMSVVLFISKKHSPFVRFHAKQGTVLFAFSIFFLFLPYANRILELLIFFLMVWGFLAAARGHWTELPIVGPLARGKLTLRGSWKQTVGGIVNIKRWATDLWKKHDRPADGDSEGQGQIANAPALPPDPKL